jgi:hypothetical protein
MIRLNPQRFCGGQMTRSATCEMVTPTHMCTSRLDGLHTSTKQQFRDCRSWTIRKSVLPGRRCFALSIHGKMQCHCGITLAVSPHGRALSSIGLLWDVPRLRVLRIPLVSIVFLTCNRPPTKNVVIKLRIALKYRSAVALEREQSMLGFAKSGERRS